MKPNSRIDNLKLFRKRFIPYEKVHLKDDIVLYFEDNILITKWNTLKPRSDISRGVSCYFIDRGFKVSKIYNSNDEIVYWYCDILDTEIDESNSTYTFNDLLIDVIVYTDGTVKVVDLAEVADALDMKLIDIDMTKKALRYLDSLLQVIYSGNFESLKRYIDEIENNNLL